MSDFHSLQISKTVKETKDAISIYFQIPEHLKAAYSFVPGQYLTLEASINGEQVRRAYSLCTSPVTDEVPAVTVKRVEGGKMSNYLNDFAKEGMDLQVMTPNGQFTLNADANNQNHYVLFGGGSGITPLMSILKTALNTEPNSRVSLVYCNRDEDSVIFADLLMSIQEQYGERLKVIQSYDNPKGEWTGLSGYLTEQKVAELLTKEIGGAFYRMCHYYICGPTPLMDVVGNGLRSAGVQDSHINTEYFTAPTSSEGHEEVEADEDFEGIAEVKVEVYGEEHEITCDEHKNILDAAIDQDLDPPYSCTVGVCTTCRAKLIKGKVEMKEREGLSDEEIEEGFVLTCQSYPRSNRIELKYE